MVNFRFHVVSLIGVFLALALGIVVGSTVVDDGIVRQLRKEIRTAEDRSDEVEAENSRLADEVDRLEAYIEDTRMFAVEDRLVGVPVAVVALRGIDGDVVDRSVELLRAAGADIPGVIWLKPDWLLEGDDAERLADTLGEPAAGDVDALRDAGLMHLARRLANRPEPSDAEATTTTAVHDESAAPSTSMPEVPTEPADLVARLEEAGFVELDSDDGDADLATFPAGRPRALVVGGTRAEPLDLDLLTATVRAFEAAGIATVAAEVHVEDDDGPERGMSVAAVRDDDALATEVSTLDDLDLPEGRVAALLALDGIGSGVVGHYGYGRGAQRSLPEWTGP